VRLSALVGAADGGLVPVGSLDPDPQVHSVITTDLLDPGRYLRGGELVLTGLAWWRAAKPARSRAFVSALTGAGVAALAAGDAAFGWVPQDLIDACGQAGLPVLRVPVAYSFAAITEHATRQLSGDDNLVAVLARHRTLVAAVAAREAGGTGLSTVLDLVARDLGVPCWVLSATGRVIAASSADAATGDAVGHADARSWAKKHLVAPFLPQTVTRSGRTVTVFGGDRPRSTAWFLVIATDHSGWTPARHALVDELVSLVGLELALSRRRPEAEVQLAQALAGSSPSDVEQSVRRVGWDPEVAVVVVAGIGSAADGVLAEVFAEVFADDDAAVWAAAGPQVIALVRTQEPAPLVARIRTVVESLAPGLGQEPLRIGVSDAVTGGAGLLAATAEARAAADSGAVSSGAVSSGAVGAGPHTVTGPDRLSNHALLLAAVPVGLRDSYRRRVLGPLLDHDRVHRTELVATLTAYLACSGSWSQCAAEMHLHVNTVRYRIERIEAMTGRDLRRLDDQTDLLLALRLP
jgi:hypothetical protein